MYATLGIINESHLTNTPRICCSNDPPIHVRN